ncbi:hypothetical protein COW36_06360 [bacterium (Candidatus Blackallbacteria) CG17_big_fil_post_rev_8_21_14_2_50_48_46]|uniref:RND efflux pump membrane fusion protein barrel-sandwich domain-containing protein n=1 Tax=bacterium (Candidatus Blackallbacteria) CG17_big_fil_post_rev_8_21_14_2_50_48_46 TaxID=2014261 RepID=A0A2M7G7U2_9BACT|nr:MAG: hypothetical protein COW64_17190 [bacterium (Candidatus Blackallbacteria) CG18_big_fil_WC_8_21_14_2_50_49_26]PIW18148.1 MAG: hypothetical protein COW36_06360 [bacterium (Candidatus Blackallbacteria) CG17_big_fil_post_rev_8_21_14_2_50_48_46]PIW47017.1 MAG: hypothetical protein COW20_13885 [bacterium (Candidatus Blackallbacteria) CG13_big_fil_rev_8_21_14_2_50_49_14]
MMSESTTDSPSENLTPIPPTVSPKPKRRLHWFWIASGILLLLIVSGVGYAQYRKAHQIWPTLVVKRRDLKESIDVSGAVFSERDVVLKAAISAQVLGRLVAENQRVSSGTALLNLDTSTYHLQLAQAQTNTQTSQAQSHTELGSAEKSLSDALKRKQLNLQNLENQLTKAKQNINFQESEYLRQIHLTEAGVTPPQRLEQQKQTLDQARLDLKTAENNLKTAQRDQTEITTARNRIAQARTALENAKRQGEASVQLARDTLHKGAINAPFSGTVARWQVNRGDYVTPGTPVARFLDTRDLRLLLNVNELDLPKVRIGAEVEITFDAYPETPYPGKVVWISESSITDSDNVQVFPVKIWFDNADHKIRPGMSADAKISAAERKNVLAIPIIHIRKKDGHYYVDRLHTGKPQETEIKLGISTLDQVEVISGLETGDQIVAEATPAPGTKGKP